MNKEVFIIYRIPVPAFDLNQIVVSKLNDRVVFDLLEERKRNLFSKQQSVVPTGNEELMQCQSLLKT
jgi:hypothetical protein